MRQTGFGVVTRGVRLPLPIGFVLFGFLRSCFLEGLKSQLRSDHSGQCLLMTLFVGGGRIDVRCLS